MCCETERYVTNSVRVRARFPVKDKQKEVLGKLLFEFIFEKIFVLWILLFYSPDTDRCAWTRRWLFSGPSTIGTFSPWSTPARARPTVSTGLWCPSSFFFPFKLVCVVWCLYEFWVSFFARWDEKKKSKPHTSQSTEKGVSRTLTHTQTKNNNNKTRGRAHNTIKCRVYSKVIEEKWWWRSTTDLRSR